MFLTHLSKILVSSFCLCCCFQIKAQSPATTSNLKTEYLSYPIGLDNSHPRFTWNMVDYRNGAKQTAIRIRINTDSIALTQEKTSLWDTGWLSTSLSLKTYSGQQLKPFTKYYWRIDIADHNQVKSKKFKISSFEMGMMSAKNWKSAWISDNENPKIKPAPYFRKTFELTKKIKSARAYIAVGGLYELSINGKKVGNHRLDPMYTRFDRRTMYVTYDVTQQLITGKNAVGVLLGNGWYNHQSTAVWNFEKAPWRNRPTFCLDLKITYEDGATETIKSGKDWKTALSPIIFNSIYTAEHYDARLEQQGWNTANFDDTKWKNVIHRSAPSDNIVAQAMHPVRNIEEIRSKSLTKFNDTTYVFDLGRNISGVSKIKLAGAEGTIVKLKHAERLYPDGRVDLSNIDVHYRPTDNTDPFQTDIVILNGKSEQSFMPHFNYKGFQYIEVSSNKPLSLKKEDLVGFFMHSDVPVAGSIKASDPLIDKMYFATNNSYLSNLFGYPTDCPQREKNGWTGDAAIAIETGLYGFDGITIYEKWLADHRDEQQPNGVLPSIIPTDGWGYEWGNGPDWTSTIAIIPWNIYLFYGDKKLLADCYDNIRRYVNHIDENYPTGLTSWGLGDWVPVKSKSPVELTSTCYYYADVIILAKAAKLLGKMDDYKKYSTLALKIKNAFNEKYLNKTTGIYNSGIQTELSVPLFWGIVPVEFKAKVAENLAKRVEADGFHLDVGLLGTKAILNALSENGYAEVAYKVASQKTFPSWGWWIANGATTLYENWPIDAKSDISMNHIMFGEIGAWLYKAPGGIKPDENEPGFKHILLDPKVVSGLTNFEASHTGPYGEIKSAWIKTDNNLRYTITIPANSSATLPLREVASQIIEHNGKIIKAGNISLSAGNHVIIIKNNEKNSNFIFFVLTLITFNVWAQTLQSTNERVTEYLEPTRVLWKTGSVKNEIRLLKKRTGQADLGNADICIIENKNGEKSSVLLDFGKEIQGGVQIVTGIWTGNKPIKIRLRFGESASEAMSEINGKGGATNDHAIRDFETLLPWLGVAELGNTGFRFVRIDVLDNDTKLVLKEVNGISKYRNLTYKGSFNSSDTLLNKIWKTGAYTVQLNMQDYLWDGIKRDRLVWVGDLNPEIATINTVFGYNEVVPKSLDFAKNTTPLPQWMNGISAYSMWWIINHRDWYYHHGNLNYLKEQQSYLGELLKLLIKKIDANGKENLDGQRFLDWPSSEDPKAIHAGLQAMMVLALQAGGDLMHKLGDENSSAECLKAVALLKSYSPATHNAKQSAALLSMAKLMGAKEADQIISEGGAAKFSTFFGYYMLEAKANAGNYEEAMEIIRNYWGAMLALGATTFWEDFNLEWTKNAGRIDELVPEDKIDIHGAYGAYCYIGFRHSLCHGWAAGPTPWLTAHVLGISVIEPGCKVVQIKPHLGNLSFAEGTFPTPFGLMKVRHEKRSDGTVKSTIDAPKGVKIIK